MFPRRGHPSSPFDNSATTSPRNSSQGTNGSSSSSSSTSNNQVGLRRIKSNHSLAKNPNQTGSRWYLEDDEEEEAAAVAGGRRPRSNSLTSNNAVNVNPSSLSLQTSLLAISRSPSLSKSTSNSSLMLFASTGGLARAASNGGIGATIGMGSSMSTGMLLAGSSSLGIGAHSHCSRSFASSTRRWSTLLSNSEHLWQEKEKGLQISPQDDRQYRVLRLPNNLKAIVVSDPTTEKAAAALSVRVGASHDPKESPGLAHFCEHMLFLGTEKFPTENTYKNLVNQNGGSSNAMTSMDLTLFKFEVAAQEFPNVLDVFSQFFIAPLFTESATEREMKAVDAENSKNIINDGRRLLQIMKGVADPNHSWAKFSTGNLATLRDDLPPGFNIRTALLDLYNEHYYAGKMALALVGREPLDALEDLVHEKFSPIKDRDLPTSSEAAEENKGEALASASASTSSSSSTTFNNPFPPRFMPSSSTNTCPNPSPHISRASASLTRQPSSSSSSTSTSNNNNNNNNKNNDEPAVPIIRVVPLRDKRELRLTWALPPIREHYRAPPTRLFGHLLGHEGEGSIFSVLHALGWASSVSAGVGSSQEDFCLFDVTISLTEQGQASWQDIASLVFHYLQLIAQAPPEELAAMWDEYRAISSTNFRFQQKSSEYSHATDLARRLQLYEEKHVLSAGYLYEELDFAEAVPLFLGRLVKEENALVFLTCKENQKDAELMNQKEKWYGVDFGLELVPAQQVRQQWTCAHVENLHLPRPNPFIAEEFDILAREEEFEPPSANATPPERALETPVLELWHKLDKSFKQPRAYIILDFASPLIVRDPAVAELLTRYINHALAEATYDAVVAGLNWSISTSHQGLSLRFNGYSHKIQTLLHKVLESLLALDLQEGLFRLSKEKAIDAYKNIALARPDEHCAIYLSLLLTEGRWDWRDKLRRVESLELSDLANFHHEVLNTSSVRVGVFGNIARECALGIGESVERLLKRNPKFSALSPSLQPVTRIAMLEAGVEYRLRTKVPNEEDVNSAVYSYFQVGDQLVGPAAVARLTLLAQIMKEPCFTQLRTREQLGYIVASGLHLTWVKGMVAGISFRVLSKTHAPEEILARVESFLPQFRDEILAKLTPEEFERHKTSLVTNLLEPPKRLVSEVGVLWAEVVNETREWKRHQLYADAVEATTLEELLELYDRVVLNQETRRKLTVMVHGNKHPMPPTSGVENEDKSIVYLTEKDWLAFRASRPLFPCSPTPFKQASKETAAAATAGEEEEGRAARILVLETRVSGGAQGT